MVLFLAAILEERHGASLAFQCYKVDEFRLKMSFSMAVHKLGQRMLSVAPLLAPDLLPPRVVIQSISIHFTSAFVIC